MSAGKVVAAVQVLVVECGYLTKKCKFLPILLFPKICGVEVAVAVAVCRNEVLSLTVSDN